MPPGFGPVFPGVRAGVGAEKTLLPIRRSAFLIITLERFAVVFALVPNTLAEAIDPITVFDQPVPVIMSPFVAKVAQYRPVRFMQLQAPFLALRVVGLRHVKGNDAVLVSRQNRRGARRGILLQKLEGKAAL